jgi:elongation factor 2
MTSTRNIRNISVIAHVDHGKSTLSDSLVGAAGLISASAIGNKRYMSVRKDEQEKGITIKSSSISLNFPYKEDGYLINLIDSPGHVDFSSEVSSALRVTDGAVVVVDSVEGCRSQTETVLRQALQERIVPVLMINKMDRAMVELQLEPEECYQNFVRIVESVNVIISTYSDNKLGRNLMVNPKEGTVAFGSGKMGWAFTLSHFAKIYATKFNQTEKKVLKHLWGDWFYCPDSKKWQKTNVSKLTGKTLKRGFCQFILDPIYEFFKVIEQDDLEKMDSMCQALSIKLTKQERELVPKDRLKVVMQKFLPAHEALLELIIDGLPSPKDAQSYRYDLLYTGPMDDQYATAIRNCDENGPLMIFISKMFPAEGSGGKFVAFGRVFSGTVKQGHKVRILGPEFDLLSGDKKDMYKASVQRTVIMMGRTTKAVDECSCGNIVGLVGLDSFIVKTATICDIDSNDAHPLKNMKYTVSPVVQIAVETEKAADIGKLVEGLKKLAKSDPLLQVSISETGQHILAGAGELHLEICLNDLCNVYCKGINITKSRPVVTFKETVVGVSGSCLVKSANHHNRLYMQAMPLSDEFCGDIESGAISLSMEPKALSRHIVENFSDWDAVAVKKIWCFGPSDNGPNVVVDATKATDFMNEIQDSVVSAFQWASREGGLCDENMRGIRFNLTEASLHSDAIHRGGGQIIPAARKAFYASQLAAEPRLVEPFYLAEIQTTELTLGGVNNVVNKRRGVISNIQQTVGSIYTVTCTIPVLESFGLADELRAATQGQAFLQCSFDRWQVMNQDPYDSESSVYKLITDIRKRKGLKLEIPTHLTYIDKL